MYAGIYFSSSPIASISWINGQFASSNVAKVGAGTIIKLAIASTLPASLNYSLLSNGTAYLGVLDSTAVVIYTGTTDIRIINPTSIADNQQLQSSSFSISYYF